MFAKTNLYGSRLRNSGFPVGVVFDMEGAVVSAALDIFGHYATFGEMNWKGITRQTVSGVARGSVGAIGKIGKWLTGLFK